MQDLTQEDLAESYWRDKADNPCDRKRKVHPFPGSCIQDFTLF